MSPVHIRLGCPEEKSLLPLPGHEPYSSGVQVLRCQPYHLRHTDSVTYVRKNAPPSTLSIPSHYSLWPEINQMTICTTYDVATTKKTWYGRRVHTRVTANMRAHITYMSHYGASVTDVGVPTAMHGLEADVLLQWESTKPRSPCLHVILC